MTQLVRTPYLASDKNGRKRSSCFLVFLSVIIGYYEIGTTEVDSFYVIDPSDKMSYLPYNIWSRDSLSDYSKSSDQVSDDQQCHQVTIFTNTALRALDPTANTIDNQVLKLLQSETQSSTYGLCVNQHYPCSVKYGEA